MQCDDPYWYNCQENAEFLRDRKSYHRPDDPMLLCQLCFDAMQKEGKIDLEEWNSIP